MSEATVYIVDDDDGLRDATQMFLRLHGQPCRAFASAAEFLGTYRPEWPGCLLLDLKMPGMDGLALQRVLAERGALLPVVIITAHGDVAAAREALKAGAADFLEKPVDNDLLLEVIGHALDQDRRRRDSEAAAQARDERIGRLTPRERQVMAGVAHGRSHREIAETLGISPRTVEVYKMRMMEKLRARTLADVIRLAGDDPPR